MPCRMQWWPIRRHGRLAELHRALQRCAHAALSPRHVFEVVIANETWRKQTDCPEPSGTDRLLQVSDYRQRRIYSLHGEFDTISGSSHCIEKLTPPVALPALPVFAKLPAVNRAAEPWLAVRTAVLLALFRRRFWQTSLRRRSRSTTGRVGSPEQQSSKAAKQQGPREGSRASSVSSRLLALLTRRVHRG